MTTRRGALPLALALLALSTFGVRAAQLPTPPPEPPSAPPQAPPLVYPTPPVAPSTAPAPAAPAPQVLLSWGIQQTFTLQSKVMGEARRINVYTPPGYELKSNGKEAYPVLYMLDGGMGEDFPHVTETVNGLIRGAAIVPVLVVGIENTERRRDTTGPTEVEKDKTIAPHVGGSAAFRKFIRTELMPEVEKRYRTSGKTAIVGESLAGLFIVETFLLEPDLFDGYMALSPSVWWNGGKLVQGAHESLQRLKVLKGTKRLYLTSASTEDEDDIVRGCEQLSKTLKELEPKNLIWTYDPMPQEHHSTIFKASEAKAYKFVFGARE